MTDHFFQKLVENIIARKNNCSNFEMLIWLGPRLGLLQKFEKVLRLIEILHEEREGVTGMKQLLFQKVVALTILRYAGLRENVEDLVPLITEGRQNLLGH